MLNAVQVLAENNFGDTRTGGLAGPMGLFLIVLLGTATVLLIRNMNSRLRRLPDRFPEPGGPVGTDRTDSSVPGPPDGTPGQESRPNPSSGHQQP
ncbi:MULTISPECIES: hypothetical protein [Micromonospora]|jgi:hypothetical protein|uniref:Uncharacterized protein n=1 Tax=Micromonospora rifamycinica TaxID=291594 RepID=A0A109IGE0_9ACTN|nr:MULTISPECIES: hypothetical protein [Micromonospora]KWV30071.1 hypothetical protein AWV63_24970 [Micromonospora rifamycinica]WFE96410.1 hypothetical protein O7612_05780 [Micromonospora sp. WMMD987]SCG60492.1 hypothetical protein GA0070623_2771 [Micromonospora rifamycinica]